MKVLYLVDTLATGGAEASLAAMAPEYSSLGVELEVAYLREPAPLRSALEAAGVPVVSLEGPGGRVGGVRRALHLIRSVRPALVHTTLFEADIVGRLAGALAGVPVVSSLVNLAYGPEQRADPRLRSWKVSAAQMVDVATARSVVRFHAITQWVAEEMGRRLRVRRDRIDVVPRGRDPDRLGRRTEERRRGARDRIGVDPRGSIVLAAARQEYQKGLDVLLSAFTTVHREWPEARLVIAGRDGNHSRELRRLHEELELGQAASFLGQRGDVLDLICAADVFVLPSRWEGLGSVLLEAMALEAPIVASDLPAVAEVLGHGSTALLAAPSQPDSLAAAILSCLRNPAEARARADRARRLFLERYTTQLVAEGMALFYERALSKGSMRLTRAFHSGR